MDIDQDRLNRAAAAADAMLEYNDVNATIETTMDRVGALTGADYVLNTIHVGGREPFGNEIETGERRRMNLNVRNADDLITNLVNDACVEVPCLVDDRDVRPCSVGKLPPQLAALDRSNVDVQRLAVEAAIEGNQAKLRQAVKLNPLSGAACTLSEIDAMLDDLLEANAEYLPDAIVEGNVSHAARTPPATSWTGGD